MKFKSLVFLVLVVVLLAGLLSWKNFNNKTKPAVNTVSENSNQQASSTISESLNTTGLNLKLPQGLAISTFAKNLPGARVIAFDSLGNMWVSQTSKGTISEIEIKDGKAVSVNPIFKNLKNPHGLAIDGTTMYIAEENKISKVALYTEDSLHTITELPKGGRHFTRTLLLVENLFKDSKLKEDKKRLLVSIGSSCDACNETDSSLASVFSMRLDGSDFRQYAKGLRNSVFMVLNPSDGKIWATEMGRDNLGDELPPDEINILQEDKDFGWPICYGKNIHDTQFDKNTYIRNPCEEPFEIPSFIDLPAHSAPLGLAFVPNSWPAEYASDLLVAFHGSWNRTTPTGYKIARIKLLKDGKYKAAEDFISGWLLKDGKTSSGRPVDIVFDKNGIMYVSDDKAGVVYKVEYIGNDKN